MTNKNSTKFLFKIYRQPITVINLTGVNFNQGKDCLRATEIRKGQSVQIIMYVMSLTHSWLGLRGNISFIRLGYVGRPCLESVVRGRRKLLRRIMPLHDIISIKRSRPTGLLPLKSRRYMCQSFNAPIPGAIRRTLRTYSITKASRAALIIDFDSSYL